MWECYEEREDERWRSAALRYTGSDQIRMRQSLIELMMVLRARERELRKNREKVDMDILNLLVMVNCGSAQAIYLFVETIVAVLSLQFSI